MRILAVDPGPEKSAVVLYDVERRSVDSAGIFENVWLVQQWRLSVPPTVTDFVFEKVESFGMAVGAEVFETVFWTGRMVEAIADTTCQQPYRIGRRAVKLHICQSSRATDANIRMALLDRYGGSEKAIGTKKAPGPLYAVRSHLWAALALAVTFGETQALSGGTGVRTPQ